MEHPKVTFIGGGELGTALRKLIAPVAIQSVWDTEPARRTVVALEEAVADADYVFYCAPAQGIASFAITCGPYLNPDTVVISLSKGIAQPDILWSDQALASSLPEGQPIALISGPMLAEELEWGSIAEVGCASIAVFNRIRMLFPSVALRFVHQQDMRGLAILGTLKNIYALLIGLGIGLGLSSNLQACLLVRLQAELNRLSVDLGALPGTSLGFAGLGGLVATGNSPFSSNSTLGKQWARGTQAEGPGEGLRSLRLLVGFLGETADSYPSIVTARDIFLLNGNPAEILRRLILTI